MTSIDINLIRGYLDRHYSVTIGRLGYNFQNKNKKGDHTKEGLVEEILVIYGNFKGEYGTTADIVQNWYYEKMGPAGKKIFEYLNECKLMLGSDNFILYHDYDPNEVNTPVTPQYLTDLFGVEYTIELTAHFINEWLVEKLTVNVDHSYMPPNY